MRAKFVLEKIDFERGKDPKRSMSLGKNPFTNGILDGVPIKNVIDDLPRKSGLLSSIIPMSCEILGVKLEDLYIAIDEDGSPLRDSYEAGYEWTADEEYDIPGHDIYYMVKDEQSGFVHVMKEEIGEIYTFGGNPGINENTNFERGQDPKKSMKLGYYPGKEIEYPYWVNRGYGSTLPDYMKIAKANIESVDGDMLTISYWNESGNKIIDEISIQKLDQRNKEYKKEKLDSEERFRNAWNMW
jgi:hypothetical protein